MFNWEKNAAALWKSCGVFFGNKAENEKSATGGAWKKERPGRNKSFGLDWCFSADPSYGIITPKAAVYTAARVQGTRPCADAQGFGNIEPCKTAAGAVLLRPFRGIDTVLLREHGRDAKCELGNMVS